MAKSNYHGGSRENECYFCGCGPPLHEHHVIPQRFDGPDTKDNIVELCHLCHQRLERLYDKSFYEWFGITDETGERKFHRQCSHGDCANTTDLLLRPPEPHYGHDHLCFKHANIYYNNKEIRYTYWSDQCVQYYITGKGWSILREKYKHDVKNSEDFVLEIEDLEHIGVDEFDPLDDKGNILHRFEIMEEYAKDYSDRIAEYLG